MLDDRSNGWRPVLCRGRRPREGGEGRKEGEVAYSASSVITDRKNVFFTPTQQKHFPTSCSLRCFFIFSESSFLKGIEVCGCWSRECISLSPGFMLTLLPEHPGAFHQGCSFCAEGELHLGKAPLRGAGEGHSNWSSTNQQPSRARERRRQEQKASWGCRI